MHREQIKYSLSAALLLAGLLILSGCNWPNVFDNDPPSDFAEKSYARHRDNGEINEAQYQKGVQTFTPAGAPPAATTAPANGTATTQP